MENFPDEVVHGPNDPKNDSNPPFTGRNSGKLNYYYCKQRPWEAYCHWKLNPHCYKEGQYNKRTYASGCKYDQSAPPFKRKKPPGFPIKKPPNMPKGRQRKRYTRKRQTRYNRLKYGPRGHMRAIKRRFPQHFGRKKANVTAAVIKSNPIQRNQFHHQFIMASSQNQRQHIFGTEHMSLYTPYDIKNYSVINPTANSGQKYWQGYGSLRMVLTNFAPVDVNITHWRFTPRESYWSAKTPLELYVQGIKDIDTTPTDQSTYPSSNPYQSPMFTQMFKITRIWNKTLKQGEQFTQLHTSKRNQVFNTEKLTQPGTVTFTPVANQQWIEGLTTFYGFSVLGGIQDVTVAGTGGVVGVGYAAARVGVVITKDYTSSVIDNVLDHDIIDLSAGLTLGLAGTTLGTAAIQNKDTGTPVATVTAGVVVNQA